MRKLFLISLVLFCVSLVHAQVSSTTTRRVRAGTTLPATCRATNPVDVFIDSDATAGSRWYICTTTNNWTVQGASAGTTINATDGVIPYRSSSTAFSDSPLARVDANTVKQVNSTTAQEFRVSNTDDGAGNNEYLSLRFSGNKAIIDTGKTGTGTNRTLRLLSTSGLLELSDNNEVLLLQSGSFATTGTNGYDLGTSSATWRTGFFGTSVISPLFRSDSAKVLIRGTGTGATQLSATQTTVPVCSTNCGTSPTVTGSDTFMKVLLGTTPASGFLITFNGTWATAPACTVQMGLAGMVVGKLALTAATTTTTITVVTNGTAPSTGDVYFIQCGGLQ